MNRMELPLVLENVPSYCLIAAIFPALVEANCQNDNWLFNSHVGWLFNNDYRQEGINQGLDIYPVNHIRKADRAITSLFAEEINLRLERKRPNKELLIESVCEHIERGYYSLAWADVSRLSNSVHSRAPEKEHWILLSGFDKRKALFHALEFDRKGKLSIIDISFNEFFDSFYSPCFSGDHFSGINKGFAKTGRLSLYKPYENLTISLDVDFIVRSIKAYLNSKNLSDQNAMCLPRLANCVWGLSVYERLKLCFEERFQKGKGLNYITTNCVIDHKKLMLARLKKLSSYGLSSSVINSYEEVLFMAKDAAALNMYLNTSLSSRNGSSQNDRVEKFLTVLNGMKNLELEIFSTVIKELGEGN